MTGSQQENNRSTQGQEVQEISSVDQRTAHMHQVNGHSSNITGPTCDTPARMPWVPCWPQLPVAREYLRPRVMVCVLTAEGRLMSLPLSTHLQSAEQALRGSGQGLHTARTSCWKATHLGLCRGGRVGLPTLLLAGAGRGHGSAAHAQAHRPHLLAVAARWASKKLTAALTAAHHAA